MLLDVNMQNFMNITTFYLMPITYKNYHLPTATKLSQSFTVEICGYEIWKQSNPGSVLTITLNTVESVFAEKEYDISTLFALDTTSTSKCTWIHSYTLCSDIACRR